MKKTKAVNWKNVEQRHVTEYVLFLFSRKEYTEAQLRDKMKQRFPEQPEFHDPAISRMKELNYLNEKEYAKRFINSLLQSNLGRNKIKEKLYNKRFDKQIAEEALTVAFECIENQESEALFWRQKWYGETAITDNKERQKALRKLVSKGFSFSDALAAIDMKDQYD
tara:strand:+ start:10533 stop:11030 length:498 start_codon:yes stop_codon:yes gene_type:complete